MRSFFETYTLANIKAEIAHRVARRRAALETKPARAVRRTSSSPYDPRHASNVGRFYDDHHAAFMQVYGEVIQAFRTRDVADLLDHQIRAMGLAPGRRVLDAGCGVGAPAIHFARHAGVEVDAITISRAQHEAATKKVAAEGLSDRVRVVLGDYHRLDEHFPKASYDVVYFLESLGHSRDKARVLDVCFEMLAPGGTLYVKDLFERIPLRPEHQAPIEREIGRINAAYHYEVAKLSTFLDELRRRGFILASLTSIDLDPATFEDLAISNVFQELTGIAPIERWADYIFPVDFFELRAVKPEMDLEARLDRHFLQQLARMKVGDGSLP